MIAGRDWTLFFPLSAVDSDDMETLFSLCGKKENILQSRSADVAMTAVAVLCFSPQKNKERS